MTIVRLLTVIMSLSIGVGCSRTGEAAAERALQFGDGASEHALVAAAGPPSQILAPAAAVCEKAGGVHELVYTITDKYLGGYLGEAFVASYSFCIGPDSTVIHTTWSVS
jgi:hypothetical protein